LAFIADAPVLSSLDTSINTRQLDSTTSFINTILAVVARQYVDSTQPSYALQSGIVFLAALLLSFDAAAA